MVERSAYQSGIEFAETLCFITLKSSVQPEGTRELCGGWRRLARIWCGKGGGARETGQNFNQARSIAWPIDAAMESAELAYIRAAHLRRPYLDRRSELANSTGPIGPGDARSRGKLIFGETIFFVRGTYRSGDRDAFNADVDLLTNRITQAQAIGTRHARYEFFFNHADPFTHSMFLYVVAFLLACLSWLGWSRPLNRTAFYLLLLALTVHTFGLFSRMYLQERPPVTNLYSSAIFIGWGAVIVALILERIFREGIGAACAGAVGFVTLVIAHHLAGSGDTLEMLQAVLDTNIWLATCRSHYHRASAMFSRDAFNNLRHSRCFHALIDETNGQFASADDLRRRLLRDLV